MAPLTRILEQARVLQLRKSVGKREAIAMALANQRRKERNSEMSKAANGETKENDGGAGESATAKLPLPAASCLDSLLPRNREPTMEEIREAWKECMEQSSLYQGEGR